MAASDLTFGVDIRPPSRSNTSRVRQTIQQQLGDVQLDLRMRGGRQAQQDLAGINQKTKDATKSTKSFGEAIGIAGRNFVAYTSAVAIVGRLGIALSRSTRDAIKFEREFVKLAQVLKTSVSGLGGLSKEISELSREFGLSANIIAKTSVILAQSGLNAGQVAIALRALSKTTLASTFQNIGQTTEGAIAIIAQFGEGAQALERQLGSINAVTKAYAAESSDLIEAVRRGGAAFVAAGGNFEEFIALFTSVRSTTRESAETISTGFRTIFARLQRPGTLKFFQDLDIQLVNMDGTFVGAFEAIKRISEGLDRLNIRPGQTRFAQIVEEIGGVRQSSRVIPLLTQFAKAQEAYNVAREGGTSLDDDVAKAQATIAQAIERTRQNFAALIREISETGSFKALIGFALALANAFTEIARTLKPLIPIIAALASIKLGSILNTAAKTGLTSGGLGTKRPFAKGGPVLGFNRGGSVPGTGNGDTVPAMLEPGEFVIRKSAVQAFGVGGLADINRYASGGSVKDYSVGAKYTVPLEHTYDKDAGSRFVKKGSKDKPRTSFNESDTFSFQEDVQGIRVTDADFVNNPKLEEQYKNQGPLKRGRAFEQIIAKRKKVQLARKASGDAASSSRLDGISPRGVPVEIKSTSQSQAGLISSKIIGGALEPRSENVDKKLEKKLNASRLTNQGNNIDFGKIILYEDQTGALGRKKTPTKKLLPVKRALGGSISGAGTDTVPALLTPGEFVVNKKSAEAFGYGGLAKINKYAKGGPVQKFGDGGNVAATDTPTSKFNPQKITNALLGLSVGLSALTAIVGNASEDMQVLIDGFADFGITLAGILAVTSFAGDKVGGFRDKITGKGKKESSEVVEAETKDINQNGEQTNKYLKNMLFELKKLNKVSGASSKLTTRQNIAQARQRGAGSGTFGPGQTSKNRLIPNPVSSAGKSQGPGLLKTFSTALGKSVTSLKFFQTILTGTAIAAAGLSAVFTIFAGISELAAKRAIEAGDIDEALAKTAEARLNKNKSTAIKVAVGGGAAIGAAVGAIGGPFLSAISAAIGAVLGFVAALVFGEKLLTAFVFAGYGVVTGLVELAKIIARILGQQQILRDLNEFQGELGVAFASLLPIVQRVKEQLNVLVESFQNATTRILKSSDRSVESAKIAFKQAPNQDAKKSAVDEVLEANRKLIDRFTRLRASAEREIDRQKGVRDTAQAFANDNNNSAPGRAIAQGMATAADEGIKAAQKKLVESYELQANATVANIATATELSRVNRTAALTYKELNNGVRITVDENNIIQGEALKDGSQLSLTYKLLRDSGLSQEQAQRKLTEAVFGSKSAFEDFIKASEAATKAVGGELKTLLFGGVEDKLKSARTIQNTAAIAGGAHLNDIQDSQGREDVIGLSAKLFNSGIEKIGGKNIRDGLKASVPPEVLEQFTRGLDGDDKTNAENALVDAIFGLDSTAADQLNATRENIKAIRENTIAQRGAINDAVIKPQENFIGDRIQQRPLAPGQTQEAADRQNAADTVQQMQEVANTFLQAVQTMPTSITMEMNGQTHNVNINGADILSAISPTVGAIVNNGIIEKIKEYDKANKSSEGSWNPTPGGFDPTQPLLGL